MHTYICKIHANQSHPYINEFSETLFCSYMFFWLVISGIFDRFSTINLLENHIDHTQFHSHNSFHDEKSTSL